MVLDVSHDCWRGAYSAFSRFRQDVARAAGYAVWPVASELGPRDTIMLDWGHVTPENLAGEWAETPADPLLVLFAHSDCDGVIHPAQAGPLAKRLREVAALMDDDPGWGHLVRAGGSKAAAIRFAAGLEAAVAMGETVAFF